MRAFHPTGEQLDACPNLTDWVAELQHRIKTNRDVVILIDGEEGNGKSTLGFRLCRFFDEHFGMNAIAWGLPKAVLVASKLEPGRSLLVDEAVEGMQSREAMSKQNRMGQKYLQVCRAKNILWVICYPSIWDLDVYSREHRVQFRVYVEKQGLAKVYERYKLAWQREAGWRYLFDIEFDAIPEDDIEWQTYGRLKDAYIREIEEDVARMIAKEEAKKD